jgi:hypothetical protein
MLNAKKLYFDLTVYYTILVIVFTCIMIFNYSMVFIFKIFSIHWSLCDESPDDKLTVSAS